MKYWNNSNKPSEPPPNNLAQLKQPCKLVLLNNENNIEIIVAKFRFYYQAKLSELIKFCFL